MSKKPDWMTTLCLPALWTRNLIDHLMFVHIMSKKPDWTITLMLPTLWAWNVIELSLLRLSTLIFVHIVSKKYYWTITLMFVYIKKPEQILAHWIITLMITLMFVHIYMIKTSDKLITLMFANSISKNLNKWLL